MTNWLKLKILVKKGNPSLQVTMGIGQFTNVVSNDDVISGSFRILTINSTPLLPKKILHKFSGVLFCPSLLYKKAYKS